MDWKLLSGIYEEGRPLRGGVSLSGWVQLTVIDD